MAADLTSNGDLPRGGMLGVIAHTVRLLLGTSFRYQRWQSVVASLGVVSSALRSLTAFWAGLIVMSAIKQDAGLAIVAVAAIVLTVAVDWAIGGAAAGARVTIAERIGFELDRRIAATTAGMPGIAHFESPTVADEVQILNQNRGRLGGGLSSLLYNVDTVVSAIVTLTMVGLVDPRLLLLALTAVPALIGAHLRYRQTQAAEEHSASAGRRARHLGSMLATPGAAMELRVFGAENAYRAWIRSAIERWRRPIAAAQTRAAWIAFAEDALFTVVLGGVIAWLVWAAVHGRASASAVVVGVVAARQIQSAMVSTVDGVGGAGGLIDTARLVRRIRWLEARAAADRQRYSGQVSPPAILRTGIGLNDVSFEYRDGGSRALDHVSIDLDAGSVVAVVGENGAGKSTLVKLLLGLYRPSSGVISVNGVDLGEMVIDEWRQQTTAAFQDHAAFEFLVRETVGVGDLPAVEDAARIERALREASADSVVAKLPDGVDTQLGTQWEGGVGLSGGQWQRLALARGLMRRTPLLLVLDEPTAALDAHAEQAMFERFTSAARLAAEERGAITLLVTHRFSTTRRADRILVLEKGKLIEDGTHEELIELGGHYADLYRLQAQGYQ